MQRSKKVDQVDRYSKKLYVSIETFMEEIKLSAAANHNFKYRDTSKSQALLDTSTNGTLMERSEQMILKSNSVLHLKNVHSHIEIIQF